MNDRPAPKYKIGQEVAIKAEPRNKGVVIPKTYFSQGEWHYTVFFSLERKQDYRESDLVPSSVPDTWIGLDEFWRNLALIKQRPLTDNLYALYGSRTQFEVYQFRPALKFLGNPEQRLLIADEVGLGKTIEAGIIYVELQARLNLSRVLIVCPSGLQTKWQDEMKLRFDQKFDILKVDRLREFIRQFARSGEDAHLRGIVSLELLRRREFIDEFRRLLFDLVIIDEAHHCRNAPTLSHQIATVLSENADAMLLLTATPLQTGNQDLFNLFRILSPGEFDNFEAFLGRLKPNEFVNRASKMLATGDNTNALKELLKVEHTIERQRFLGNPYYREVLYKLEKNFLSQDELVRLQRRLTELNTLAHIFTRARKRDIAEKMPIRRAVTQIVEFSPAETKFYNQVIRHVRDDFAALYGSERVSGWVSIMRERQVASCISAARKRFTEITTEITLDISSEEQSFFDQAIIGEWDEDEVTRNAATRRLWYQQTAERLPIEQKDSKFEAFWETLRSVLDEDDSSKVIVFSFFRDTIDYLYRRLNQLGIRVLRIHGGFKVEDRAVRIEEFRTEPSVRVLISSDVGAEGLDFQFCNTIFNYDLPWNPMKVEQRIGRVDRFGQESPVVRIYNMVIADSVESRILVRLYERIGLFERAVGDIEAILGEEIRELTRLVYTSQLTEAEEEELADEAARKILGRQQEMEEFEKQRLQFMGQEAIFQDLVNQTIELGNYVSETEIYGLVDTFLRDKFARSHLDRNEPFDGSYSLEVNEGLRDYMKEYVQKQKPNDQTAQEFLRDLLKQFQRGKPLPVTFSNDLAKQRKLLSFVTLRHPLAQAATSYWRERIDPSSMLAHVGVYSDSVLSGSYFFFVFGLEAHGAERVIHLVPVAIVPENGDVHTELSRGLLHLFQTKAFHRHVAQPQKNSEQIAQAEEMAKKYMTIRRDEIEEEIKRSNEALVNARLAALEQSYGAKRRRLEETVEKVSDTRILRMYEGQQRNMEVSFERKKAEIESRRSISVSFGLLLKGMVDVAKDENKIVVDQDTQA